ncbi:hypothetical protein [Novosphingobium soli]|uniref:Pectate lyase superfamily protein domain-containing protein n=1 Tax=Novosphingobium soli TaxID=574956 RepID=A0ABV6CVH9_9SPHN
MHVDTPARAAIRVLETQVDGALTSSDYKPTLQEAISSLDPGSYFNSDDQGEEGPYPGVRWIYQITNEPPFYTPKRRWGKGEDFGYPDDPNDLPVSEAAQIQLESRSTYADLADPTKGANLLATASGLAMQDVLDYNVGVPTGILPTDTPQQTSDKLDVAVARAELFGVAVLLPPFTIYLARTVRVSRLLGTPGKSKIDVSNITMGAYPLSQFCIVNKHWSTSYNAVAADRVRYYGFEVVTTPNKVHSLIGLANVEFADIERIVLRANRAINPITGKPFNVDALLDFYASVHGGYVRRCQFYQLTGAYGATRVSAGGGGCIWIRNLCSDGSVAINVTEKILIDDSDIYHYTTDEAVAIFGVYGITRLSTVGRNRIYALEAADLGLPLSESIYRATLLSIFPHASATTAGVYDNEFADNRIVDKSTMYNVIRFGESTETLYRCENNASRRNKVEWFFSTDASYGPDAVWQASGSPGLKPSTANTAIRCIDGTPGAAYLGAFSGNISEGDEVVVRGGATIIAGFNGWQTLKSGATRGAITMAALSCAHVEGGKFEASLRGFANCNHVSGPDVRVNVAGGAIFAVSSSAGGNFSMTGARAIGNGPLLSVPSEVTGSTRISLTGNSGSLSATTPVLDAAPATTVIRASGNVFSQAGMTIKSGAATYASGGNTWGAQND